MQVGVHSRAEYPHAPELVVAGAVAVVTEGAGDEQVEARLRRLARRRRQVRPRHRPELRADEDPAAPLALPLREAPLRADVAPPGPADERREPDAVLLPRLLHARDLQILHNDLREVPAVRRLPLIAVARPRLADRPPVDVLLDERRAVRRQILDRERPGDADALPVDIGFVVEIFLRGVARDGGVNLPLAGEAPLAPRPVRRDRLLRPAGLRRRGNLPLFPRLAERRVQLRPQRLQDGLPLLPDDVDLAVVGDVAQRHVGHALIDETLPHILVGGRVRGGAAR